MKFLSILFFIFCLFFFFAGKAYAQDTTARDTTKKIVPTYTNVDVIMETDWGEPNTTENVDVFIKMKNKKPVSLIVMKGDYQNCEISIISGIVLKIIDHKTKKLIRTLK